ncbi:hypothetical protein NUSPORA_00779 [Nucleospora cyclopteri]
MVKIDREEISYKKLYKDLDLDRDLGIKWPEVQKPTETVEIKIKTGNEKIFYSLDEFDQAFCAENNVNELLFKDYFGELDGNFDEYLKEKVKTVELMKSGEICEICGYDDSDEGNKIVICQGCGINVHQECYGILNLTDRWLCCGCINYFDDPHCEFCSNKNGILKKTDQNEFIHVICALLSPTLNFINESEKEPVDTFEYQPIEGDCGICGEPSSTLSECSFLGCPKAFHPSCACGILYCDINNSKIYCAEHSPLLDQTKVLSRNNIDLRKEGYSPLKKEIFERNDRKLQEIKKTRFMEIAKEIPKTVKESPKTAKEIPKTVKEIPKTVKEIIEKYWIEKRSFYKTSFTDMFFLANCFLSKNK